MPKRTVPFNQQRVPAKVPHFINTTTFAARDFWPRRGASDAHTLPGSVRSEQRRLGQKEPPRGETPNTKHQTPEKFQISNPKTQKQMPGPMARRPVFDLGAW